jgi:hypothetical protein
MRKSILYTVIFCGFNILVLSTMKESKKKVLISMLSLNDTIDSLKKPASRTDATMPWNIRVDSAGYPIPTVDYSASAGAKLRTEHDSNTSDSAVLSCRLEMRFYIDEEPVQNVGDEWTVSISVTGIRPGDRYHIQLLDRSIKHGILLSKPITEDACRPYDDGAGGFLLAFVEDFNYFRICPANCTLAQRTGLPSISLELRQTTAAAAAGGGGGARPARLEPCRDSSDPDPPPPAAAAAAAEYALEIVAPESGAALGSGPVDVRYVLRRADPDGPCRLAAVEARLGGELHTEVQRSRRR